MPVILSVRHVLDQQPSVLHVHPLDRELVVYASWATLSPDSSNVLSVLRNVEHVLPGISILVSVAMPIDQIHQHVHVQMDLFQLQAFVLHVQLSVNYVYLQLLALVAGVIESTHLIALVQ